jgi:hypothetical protein
MPLFLSFLWPYFYRSLKKIMYLTKKLQKISNKACFHATNIIIQKVENSNVWDAEISQEVHRYICKPSNICLYIAVHKFWVKTYAVPLLI